MRSRQLGAKRSSDIQFLEPVASESKKLRADAFSDDDDDDDDDEDVPLWLVEEKKSTLKRQSSGEVIAETPLEVAPSLGGRPQVSDWAWPVAEPLQKHLVPASSAQQQSTDAQVDSGSLRIKLKLQSQKRPHVLVQAGPASFPAQSPKPNPEEWWKGKFHRKKLAPVTKAHGTIPLLSYTQLQEFGWLVGEDKPWCFLFTNGLVLQHKMVWKGSNPPVVRDIKKTSKWEKLREEDLKDPEMKVRLRVRMSGFDGLVQLSATVCGIKCFEFDEFKLSDSFFAKFNKFYSCLYGGTHDNKLYNNWFRLGDESVRRHIQKLPGFERLPEKVQGVLRTPDYQPPESKSFDLLSWLNKRYPDVIAEGEFDTKPLCKLERRFADEKAKKVVYAIWLEKQEEKRKSKAAPEAASGFAVNPDPF